MKGIIVFDEISPKELSDNYDKKTYIIKTTYDILNDIRFTLNYGYCWNKFYR